MKKFFVLLIFLGSLFSCGNDSTIDSSSTSSFGEESIPSYDDIAEYKISPNELYTKEDDAYLVYFYSKFCPSCNSMKEQLISNINEFTMPLYIVDISDNSYNFDEMPFLRENNVLENRKIDGVTTIEETPFSQTPCLYQIENNSLTYWINDYYTIYTFFNTKTWVILN